MRTSPVGYPRSPGTDGRHRRRTEAHQISNGSHQKAGRASLQARLRRVAGAARISIEDPGHGIDRALGRARRLLGPGGENTAAGESSPEPERQLHEHLAVSWPCPEIAQFEALWSEMIASMDRRGLQVGREAYDGWDDGDRRLARVVWCATRHLRPRAIVETGVARGLTSRVMLEALERNGEGHLWSIDLPALDRSTRSEIGAAIPPSLHGRWTYVSGTSRRRLPKLLAELGAIELFVHDSSHTTRNVSFELEQAWQSLQRGVIVADDVHLNAAFTAFTRRHADASSILAQAEDARATFAIILKGL